jgi:hypothetical protein
MAKHHRDGWGKFIGNNTMPSADFSVASFGEVQYHMTLLVCGLPGVMKVWRDDVSVHMRVPPICSETLIYRRAETDMSQSGGCIQKTFA